MKKSITGISIILGFTSSVALADGESFIVKFKNHPSSVKSYQVLKSHPDFLDEIKPLNLMLFKQSESLKNSLPIEEIEYIETNDLVFVAPTSADIMESLQTTPWGISYIKAPQSWPMSKGDGIVVAISDTGVIDHGDLKENIWLNPGENGRDSQGRDKAKNNIDDDSNGYIDDFRGWNFVRNSKDSRDDHYHGTHVAGTVAAVNNDKGVVGAAPKAKLMSLKFIAKSGSGTELNGAKTIVYAADNGAKIVNCSWGGTGASQAIEDAIAYAARKGVLVVAAAGNSHENTDTSLHIPSSIPLDNIISVGAHTSGGGMSYFSNYGLRSVDLAAPGSGINSTFNSRADVPRDYQKPYASLSGTSMAAPHVSGTAALLWSKSPQLSWIQIKEAILSSVKPNSNWTGRSVTGGTLDANAALQVLSN